MAMNIKEINMPIGWASGSFPDVTRLSNFHTSSERRVSRIFEEVHICKIRITDRWRFIINDSPDPNAVFSERLVNAITAPDPIAQQPVYAIPEVWVNVEDLDLPLRIVEFSADRKEAVCETRFLSGSIGRNYENNTTAIYRCTFYKVAISPTYFGTWAGGMSKMPNNTYTITLKAKFSKNAQGQYPVTTYLRMMKKNNNGRWEDYIPQVLNGGLFKDNAVDEYGYVEYIVINLPGGSEFSAWIADETGNNTLRQLVMAGDTSSPFFMNANKPKQPMIPCRFVTPPDDKSKEIVRFATLSCVDGTLAGLDGVAEKNFDFMVWNGDTFYQDSCEDERDFVLHYESLFRNEYFWRAFINTTNYINPDDHEVTNNWDTRIVFSSGNESEFLLTPDENDLYNQIMANPSNVPYVVFTRSGATGQGYETLVNAAVISDAYKALDRVLPGIPFHTDRAARNHSIRWGPIEAIFINAKPYVYEDGRVEYWKRRAIQHPDNSVTYLNESPQFIPEPGIQYLKQVLKNSKALVKCVFIAPKITPLYKNYLQTIKNKFVEMANNVSPTPDPQLVESLFRKLYNVATADKVDYSYPQMDALISWIKKEKIDNVVFFTGDPHTTYIQYYNNDRRVIEVCTSTIGNYRSAGSQGIFFGDPSNKNNILALNSNNYAEVEVDPKKKEMTVKLCYGREVRGSVVINLS